MHTIDFYVAIPWKIAVPVIAAVIVASADAAVNTCQSQRYLPIPSSPDDLETKH